ncbi:MAG: HAD-IIIA family hydrolase [Bacilli bacterium]|nr:HAD-IIIA family hydrolase [Bacilli bacterium]
MIALIQAGGAGTRLKSITGDTLLKPMVPIGGKPILEHQVISLARSGVEHIWMVCPGHTNQIEDYFGDGSKWGVSIHYFKELIPLGTGGALFYAAKVFKEDFFLLFGDLMLDIDFGRFMKFHKAHNSIITTFAHPNSHPYDSDVLVPGENSKVVHLLSKKEPRDFYYENLTNAGVYVVSKELLDTFLDLDEPVKMDFEKELLMPSIYADGVYAYRSSEYVKDCGTPDRYESVGRDLEKGVVESRNLRNKQRAIFLDRDGVINKFGNFVKKADALVLKEDAPGALKRINESPFLAICITNQPVVARGETTFGELKQIHDKMQVLLGERGSYLNGLYFCPHHPDKGFEGEVPELKFDCDCRKPKIGMLLKAKEDFNIDLEKSWFVGDTKQDVQTGINANCRTILITSGDPNPDGKYPNAKPDFICKDLAEAVDIIFKEEGVN